MTEGLIGLRVPVQLLQRPSQFHLHLGGLRRGIQHSHPRDTLNAFNSHGILQKGWPASGSICEEKRTPCRKSKFRMKDI
jgi:hypothetical protein